MTDKEWFGRKAPVSAPCAWGARAIFQSDGESPGHANECRLCLRVTCDCASSPANRERDPYTVPPVEAMLSDNRESTALSPRKMGDVKDSVTQVSGHQASSLGGTPTSCSQSSARSPVRKDGEVHICAYLAVSLGPDLPPPVPKGKWKAPAASRSRIKSRPRSVGYGR